MKKVFRSCLVMMLVAVMIFTNVTPAFAAGSGDKTINYVSFGDSTTNGYYLNATKAEDGTETVPYLPKNASGNADWSLNVYGWSREVTWAYPTLIRDYLEDTMGYDVNFSPMAISGSRMDDLRSMLDESYTVDSYGIAYFSDPKNGWFGHLTKRAQTLIDSNQDPSGNLKNLLTIFNNEGENDPVKTIRIATRKAVAEADLITIDLGMNNFGTYVTENLGRRIGIQEGPVHNIDWRVVYPDRQEEGYQLMAALYQKFNCPELVGEWNAPANSQIGLLFASIVMDAVYGYMGYVEHFDASMKIIAELNPDATVVFIAPYNSMIGISLEGAVDGVKKSIPLGDAWEFLLGKANSYAKNYDPAPGVTYMYIDPVSTDSRVHLMYDQLTEAYDDYKNDVTPSVTTNMFGTLRPMLDSAINNNPMIDSAYAAVDAQASMINAMKFLYPKVSVDGFKNAISEGVSRGADSSVHKTVAPTLGAILENNAIDMNEMLKPGLDFNLYMNYLVSDMTAGISHNILDEVEIALRAYLTSCDVVGTAQDNAMNMIDLGQYRNAIGPANEPASTIPASAQSVLSLYLRVMFEAGVMIHPDEEGYAQMANAVKGLYSVSSASVDVDALSRAGGDVTVTLSGSNMPNGLSVYAACGDEVIYAKTSGSASTQTATITIPKNSGDDEEIWKVGYGSLSENMTVSGDKISWDYAEEKTVMTFCDIENLAGGSTMVAAKYDASGRLSGVAVGVLVDLGNGAYQVEFNGKVETGWTLFSMDTTTFAPIRDVIEIN